MFVPWHIKLYNRLIRQKNIDYMFLRRHLQWPRKTFHCIPIIYIESLQIVSYFARHLLHLLKFGNFRKFIKCVIPISIHSKNYFAIKVTEKHIIKFFGLRDKNCKNQKLKPTWDHKNRQTHPDRQAGVNYTIVVPMNHNYGKCAPKHGQQLIKKIN